jgi:hypothetical protein
VQSLHRMEFSLDETEFCLFSAHELEGNKKIEINKVAAS